MTEVSLEKRSAGSALDLARADVTPAEEWKPNYTVWLAWIGIGVILLQLYIFGAWILSGDATPTTIGPNT